MESMDFTSLYEDKWGQAANLEESEIVSSQQKIQILVLAMTSWRAYW